MLDRRSFFLLLRKHLLVSVCDQAKGERIRECQSLVTFHEVAVKEDPEQHKVRDESSFNLMQSH